MKFSVSTAVSLFALASSALGASYSRSDSVVGADFNTFFNYEAIADPTHGRVNYVDQGTAQSQNLTYSTSNSFVLRADDTTVLSANGPGRNSVRLSSNKQYSTHVAVFDIRHMPEGCGTWPAVWELGNNWPSNGEVDIIEGVNNQPNDQTTLHTSPGCTIPASGTSETGSVLATNCDVTVNGNAGCGVQVNAANSFGPGFNNAGGGWYAIERTTDFIKVWFWSASGGAPPADVSAGGDSVNTDNWGTPTAFFPNTDCDLSSKFGPNNILINLTLCGDWAGSVYPGNSGCPSTCVDYVNNNPSGFSKAYFDFASINVYQ